MLQRPPMAALVRYNREINAGVERQQRADNVSVAEAQKRRRYVPTAFSFEPIADV